MKGSYTYPAVISRHEDYADITFPDFDIATCSESSEPSAVIEAAQELLAAAAAKGIRVSFGYGLTETKRSGCRQ